MGKKHIPLIVVVLALVLAGGITVLASQIPGRAGAIVNVRKFLAADDLEIELESPDRPWNISVFHRRILDEDYYGAVVGSACLYYHDDVIYLDNGRGYDLEGLLPEFPMDIDEAVWLLLLTEYRKENTVNWFEVTDNTLAMLKRFAPEFSEFLPLLAGCRLRVDQDLLLEIPEYGTIRISHSEQNAHTIPTDLLMVMKAGNAVAASEFLPLVHGCVAWAEAGLIGLEAELSLECGPLPIRDQSQLFASQEGLWMVRNGRVITLGTEEAASGPALILGLGYLLCRDGSTILDETGNRIYRLALDAPVISGFFDAIVPEAAGLEIQFGQAACSIAVSQDRICKINLSCSGEMPFWITRLPIVFSADLTPIEGDIQLPEEITGKRTAE